MDHHEKNESIDPFRATFPSFPIEMLHFIRDKTTWVKNKKTIFRQLLQWFDTDEKYKLRNAAVPIQYSNASICIPHRAFVIRGE